MAQIEFVGVDGCKFGWFSVGFAGNGEFELNKFAAFSELVEYYKDAKLILVDIPIGLPDCKEERLRDEEVRLCDKMAKDLLTGGLKSSIFPTPTRKTVHTAWQFPKDHAKASDVEKKCTGKGISIQAFSIAPKIAEVDKVMVSRGDGATPQIREVHPEICFWALNGRQQMSFSKKTKEGLAERLAVLLKVEPQAQEIFDAADKEFLKKDVARDDILDALAAAVTARRGWQSGGLRTLPDNPGKDSEGLAMEMVYWIPE